MATTKTELYNNGTLVATKTSAPFNTFDWTPASGEVGSASLTVKRYEDGVLVATSAAVGGTVDAASAGNPALLDTYSGGAAAYSVRKLRADYSGSAIEVRRSSDNALQNIGFDANGDLDTTALTNFVGANDGFVSKWYDQIGTNNAVQATTSSQAKIVEAGSVVTKNTKPAIKFASSWYDLGVSSVGTTGLFADNTQQFMTLNVFSTTQGSSILLAKASATSGQRTYYSYFYTPAGSTYTPTLEIRGGTTTTNAGLNDGNPHSLFVDWNGTDAIATWDNTSNLALNVGTYAENTQNINLGARTGGQGILHIGTMQEVIIWDASKVSDISNIKTDVNTYYGI
jgi:hypothetical protein